ncbi:tyrosine-type recombinase/integrase [Wenzhouxiangella marina]|uniref:Uncharacterized protein n=1 Tax=Wenzhouxiangella marina TaxID=1579979 RepID=A0A0K0XZ68_9GAMM|nr:hypothetical protein [Wenzhouxiangella marina]AKS42927.1 hypothetical protein WM2015_2569 [Wenzhouxiangella marina]MBB6087390.1 integrase [Wenzhouxiangella marina]
MTTSKRKTRTLTTRTVDALKPRQAASEPLGYGAGALEAQGRQGGARYFFRYGKPQRRVALPDYNGQGHPLSLTEARTKARALSARFLELRAEGRDLLETLEAEKLAAERARKAERRQAEEYDANPITFGALMAAYIEWMEQGGKVSAYDAGNTIGNHIEHHAEQWNKPAKELTLDDVLAILEPLTTAGKLTTARKVRAYIRRAYALGLRAKTSAQASAFRRFQISHNPAADTAPIEGANNSRDVALSLSELRAVWKRANRPDEPAGPLVRTYLLLGGQRFEQLRRATVADVADERLTLWDPKGKRTQPRRHVVPILPEAQAAIDEMRGAKLGPFLVTLTQGESGADRSKVGKQVKAMARRMVEAGEITKPFTLGALRSTVETQLAAAGVQSDTLAQLQSHGLSGVQWRHYNRHDYFAEKLAALEKLRDLMTQAPAKVSSLDEARKADRRA